MNTASRVAPILSLASLISWSGAPTNVPSSESVYSEATFHTIPQAVPPAMRAETAIFYLVAISGDWPGVIDVYGRHFDGPAYQRAMVDEFERNRYRQGIAARIAAAAAKVDFSDKFTYETVTHLREYSFTDHAFPIELGGDLGAERYVQLIYEQKDGLKGVFSFEATPFSMWAAVNANEFRWAVPMTEAEGSAFVKSRPNRRVRIRITYSAIRQECTRDSGYGRRRLCPYIHSVEVFDDVTARRLGIIPKIGSSVPAPLNRADQQAADQRDGEQRKRMLAQAATTIVGMWRRAEGGTYEFRADGSFTLISATGSDRIVGVWLINDDVFTLIPAGGRTARAAWTIVSIDSAVYEMRDAAGVRKKGTRIR